MGFDVGANRARLVFEEGSVLHGATVRVSLAVKVGTLFELQQALPGLISASTPEEAARADELCEAFIDSGALLSWDLEREDDDDVMKPIPIDRDGFMSLRLEQRLGILAAWVMALGNASTPAPKPSSASTSTEPVSITGARSEAPFEQMAAV